MAREVIASSVFFAYSLLAGSIFVVGCVILRLNQHVIAMLPLLILTLGLVYDNLAIGLGR